MNVAMIERNETRGTVQTPLVVDIITIEINQFKDFKYASSRRKNMETTRLFIHIVNVTRDENQD
jgi:hypothetical protein